MYLNDSEVFVIDDDPDARDAVAALVHSLGLSVHQFPSAESFFEAYSGHRPACIITDLRMLGMTGLELLYELKRRGLTIPVILLTAYADTRTTVQAMKAGAFTTLDKPTRESELFDIIRDALQDDMRRAIDDQVRHDIRDRLDSLTSSEREVLHHLLAGESNKQIAHLLNIGLRTVEARKQSVHQKMQTDSIAELVQQVMLGRREWLPVSNTVHTH